MVGPTRRSEDVGHYGSAEASVCQRPRVAGPLVARLDEQRSGLILRGSAVV